MTAADIQDDGIAPERTACPLCVYMSESVESFRTAPITRRCIGMYSMIGTNEINLLLPVSVSVMFRSSSLVPCDLPACYEEEKTQSFAQIASTQKKNYISTFDHCSVLCATLVSCPSIYLRFLLWRPGTAHSEKSVDWTG